MPFDVAPFSTKETRAAHLEIRARSVFKFVVAGGAIFLLLSMGGAIFGAPALIPALWIAGRSSGRWGAAGFTFLAALVMTEVGWAITYLTVREDQPWITLGPALGLAGTIVVFSMTLGRSRKPNGIDAIS
jgi:hypothetical protein